MDKWTTPPPLLFLTNRTLVFDRRSLKPSLDVLYINYTGIILQPYSYRAESFCPQIINHILT